MLELAPPVVDIPLLVPDMPPAAEILPWLVRIDATRCYTNFGPLLREFESGLARFWESGSAPPEVVGVSSGTAALELGIAALGLPAGARVLLPSFTFPATASAPLRHGLLPLLADVAPETWQLTPELARRAARRHPLALVMPVATFGCPVDVAGWDAFVEETGIPVLIDAAAGFGNQALGLRACVAFSFHATKPFGIGEGGARQPAFAAYPCCGPAGGARLPVTEYLDQYALGLPWFAHMTTEHCAAVVSALGRVLEEGIAYGD